MKIKDREAYDTWVEANTDPYGSAVIRFAETWADYMEINLEDGIDLDKCAEPMSKKADNDIGGITGFMYGCAVSFLSQCWEYGEQLRMYLVLMLIVASLFCCIGWYIYHYASSNTKYASQFKLRNYFSIETGASEQQVEELLGNNMGCRGHTSAGDKITCYSGPKDPEIEFILFGFAYGTDNRVKKRVVEYIMD